MRECLIFTKEEDMENRIVVTVNDYQRLMGLTEFASLKVKMPYIANRLLENLKTARRMLPQDIDGSIITMNSRVRLKDLASEREMEIAITYPQDAEPVERRVSVFSEIGLALFGRKEKEVVSWRVPGGVGSFEITKITYQPEAAGDFYL
jgi:regulator of nucleoside diphosphate kinase